MSEPALSGRLAVVTGASRGIGAAIARALAVRLSVANPGGDRLSFTAALHTYLRVADAGRARMEGLQGVRYRSALGPLRVDWGYKLNRRSGESAYRFHFTLGHAF